MARSAYSLGVLLTFLFTSAILPVAAHAQTPTYLTQWGSWGTSDGQFDQPYRVTVDPSGNVYVADTNNHRIQKFDATGTYVTQWGSNGTGNGQFSSPRGVGTDASGNVLRT